VNYLAQIQRGIDYIEANLSFDVQTGQVARHAGLSHWHFQRIFKALTNETLKTYIRSRRFSMSLEKLAHGTERILEIALEAGFESQESFTRAFKRAFGVTPAHYRRHRNQFLFSRKVRFDAAYLKHLHRGVSLEPEIYEQPEMNLVGLKTLFYGVDSEKNNLAKKLPKLWGNFLQRSSQIQGRVPGLFYGVVRQKAELGDELEYVAAVEVLAPVKIPPGMVALTVPAARYAKFAHRGPVGLVDQTVNYVYSSWLLRSSVRHTMGCDLEFYGSEYDPTSDQSVTYYAVPFENAD
jgi:AraC-like DNA-binding protein/predicted transcriptional regulator YdeE